MTNRHINLTKAVLNALPIPATGERTVVYDRKTPGLQLRVTPAGSKTFSVFRRIKSGRPERITVGKYPTMSIEQARRAAAKINAAIEDRQNPAEIRRNLRGEQTLDELFEQYLERHSRPRKRTWKEDKSKYRQYLSRSLGAKKVSAIGRSDIAVVHSAITRAGHPITANRVLALASSVFGWSISVGLAETNPARGIRRNPENSRDRFLRGHELPRFFRSLAEEPNTTMRDFFLICLLTGARRQNVLQMQWKDVSLDRAEWRISRTKNNLPQLVTLCRPAVELLTARREGTRGEIVFPSDRKKGPIVETRKAWERLFDRDELDQLRHRLQQAGHPLIPMERETMSVALQRARTHAADADVDVNDARLNDLRVHDLRRTLGSWQAMLGASLAIIGKSLNHKSMQATMVYARLDNDPIRDSVQRATTAILAAGGMETGAIMLERPKRAA
jgi:integrase